MLSKMPSLARSFTSHGPFHSTTSFSLSCHHLSWVFSINSSALDCLIDIHNYINWARRVLRLKLVVFGHGLLTASITLCSFISFRSSFTFTTSRSRMEPYLGIGCGELLCTLLSSQPCSGKRHWSRSKLTASLCDLSCVSY